MLSMKSLLIFLFLLLIAPYGTGNAVQAKDRSPELETYSAIEEAPTETTAEASSGLEKEYEEMIEEFSELDDELDSFKEAPPSSLSKEQNADRKKRETLEKLLSELESKLRLLSKNGPHKKENQKTKKAYDAVPKGHAAKIAQRLRIIEKLILRHNRAYDYRSKNLRELQEILASLETKKRKSN